MNPTEDGKPGEYWARHYGDSTCSIWRIDSDDMSVWLGNLVTCVHNHYAPRIGNIIPLEALNRENWTKLPRGTKQN